MVAKFLLLGILILLLALRESIFPVPAMKNTPISTPGVEQIIIPAVDDDPVFVPSLPLPGLELIKEFEGFYPNAYPDPLSGGKPITIGWGSTLDKSGKPFHLGQKITKDQADELLEFQLEFDYLPELAKIPGWLDLNINQQGALLSFAYNFGAYFYDNPRFKTISKVLKNREWSKIKQTFLLYRNPGTNVESGLKRRRLAEADLFLRPFE